MEHQFSFTVTKDLVANATRRFWLQFIGWGGLIRWAVVSLVLIILSAASRQAWSYAAVAIVVVSLPLVWGMGYFTFLRRAFNRYDRMQSKLITYRFNEQGVETQSDFGSAQVPWRMLDRVQRYPDIWLLFFGQRDYVYIPADQLAGPLKQYILQQAEEHGIKTA